MHPSMEYVRDVLLENLATFVRNRVQKECMEKIVQSRALVSMDIAATP